MRCITHMAAMLVYLASLVPASAMDAVHADAEKAAAKVAPAPVDSKNGQVGRCRDLSVEVVAGSAEEHNLVCAAATTTLNLLNRCNIGLKRLLRVEVMSEVRHPFSGPILGMFDTARERVLVARESEVPELIKDTPYASLQLRDFYKSLVVHEIVHGVMHQNLRRRPTTHAAHEYPAYALQIEALPAEAREAFLRSFDKAALNSDALFSDPILFFDPYLFAARAYHHYRSAPDACAQLAGLLSDEVAFIAPPM